MSQPASAPGPNGRIKTSPPPTVAPVQSGGAARPDYGTGPKTPSPQGGAPEVGLFAPRGGSPEGRGFHPGQAYSGIGHPAAHRAYYLSIAKFELAGAAGVREGDAMLRREIRRADNLTQPQKAKAMWRIRRANRRLAGAMEAAAKAAATGAKVRAEVNADILSAKRKRRAGGFTVA